MENQTVHGLDGIQKCLGNVITIQMQLSHCYLP
jgi:hypothetical protein